MQALTLPQSIAGLDPTELERIGYHLQLGAIEAQAEAMQREVVEDEPTPAEEAALKVLALLEPWGEVMAPRPEGGVERDLWDAARVWVVLDYREREDG